MQNTELHPAVEVLGILPAPWQIEVADNEEYYRGDRHYNVGPAVGMESEANAHLIAASPEMLSWMVEIMEAVSDPDANWTEAQRKDFDNRGRDIIRRASSGKINL